MLLLKCQCSYRRLEQAVSIRVDEYMGFVYDMTAHRGYRDGFSERVFIPRSSFPHA